jgi:HD superfamily phosphohydrolase
MLPELEQPDKVQYWRRVVRMAALCHDIGHLPFSHAAEKDLLPKGFSHEKLSAMLIESDEMKAIWNEMTPPIRPEDIVKLALGPKESVNQRFAAWEAVLSEIIVGDAFGVDRIDYLLRDSHHAGVAYGRFDHFRLCDTLRILPSAPGDDRSDDGQPMLGVEEGGLHSAEALLLARYFMYCQVYFHPVRRIYDVHLKDYLKAHLPSGHFPITTEEHLKLTDNEITSAMLAAANDSAAAGHDPARRIIRREHFRLVYQQNPRDLEINPEAGAAIYEALCAKFGAEHFRRDHYRQKGGAPEFPVRMRDGQIVSSTALSETLARLPVVFIDFVFSEPEIAKEAQRFIEDNRADILKPKENER